MSTDHQMERLIKNLNCLLHDGNDVSVTLSCHNYQLSNNYQYSISSEFIPVVELLYNVFKDYCHPFSKSENFWKSRCLLPLKTSCILTRARCIETFTYLWFDLAVLNGTDKDVVELKLNYSQGFSTWKVQTSLASKLRVFTISMAYANENPILYNSGFPPAASHQSSSRPSFT